MNKLSKSTRELSSSEKIILGILTFLSVAFVFWILVLSPAINKLAPLEKSVKELDAQVKNIGNVQKDIENYEKQLETLKVQYDEATKVISKTDRYPELVKQIREMAEGSSLKITNETFGVPAIFTQEGAEVDTNAQAEGTQVQGLQTLNISLSLEGDSMKILEFIGKLESDKRILDVNKFNTSENRTEIELIYFIAGGDEKEEYDFNNSSYGKENIFN